MNGWLLVRIAGIVVGIATLLRLATSQGIVTYDPLFQAWMDELRDWVELGVPLDKLKIVLDVGLDWVRSFGWHVPNLNEIWRPVFVLAALYLGAKARNEGAGTTAGRNEDGSYSYISDYDNVNPNAWLHVLEATVCSLVGAIIAGLSPAHGILAGYFVAENLFNASTDARLRAWGNIVGSLIRAFSLAIAALVPGFVWVALVPIALDLRAALFPLSKGSLVALVTVAIIACTFFMPGVTSSFQLLAVVAHVALQGSRAFYLGLKFAFIDWSRGEMNLRRGWTPAVVTFVGLDILGVLLGALGIASFFANPPIW